MAFLDGNGVLYLWQKIVNKFVAKETGKGLSEANFTTAEKTKLSGIEASANKTVVEDNLTSTSTTNALSSNMGRELDEKIKAINTNIGNLGGGDMLRSVYDTDGDGKVDMANDSEKLDGMSLQQMYDEMIMNSTVISGVLADATCNKSGVIVPYSKQPIADENGNLTYSVVDYYPIEILEWLKMADKDAVITFRPSGAIEFEDEEPQFKLPIKYKDGTIVETLLANPNGKLPTTLSRDMKYTLVLQLRTSSLNDEGKFTTITCYSTNAHAEDSNKLGGYTRDEVRLESVIEALIYGGSLPRGVCDESGVIVPDEPWYYLDEYGIPQYDETTTQNAYEGSFVVVGGTTKHITLSVTSDIEPVDGKLPLKLKIAVFGAEIPDTIIDTPSNSPLRAGKTYNFILDTRKAAAGQTENGFVVTGLKGEIIGFAPDTDTEPTEGSNNFLTSGAIYTALEDTKEKVYETIDPWIESIGETMGEIAEIAEGKCKSFVFATVDELDTWLTDSTNTAKLKVGDVFLIKAVDVPDYWWDGTEKQKLETTKVDLTAITNAEIDQIIGS